MKKLVFLLVIITGVYIGYNICLKFNTQQDENTNIINNTLNDLQAQIDTYKQKEQEEKIRKLELQQLQNPQIISTKLAEVGKLLVYEGTMKYSDVIREKNWYSNKELTLELLYNFGISIDLQDITVDKFIDKTIVLNIPINELKIEYTELDLTNESINSKSSLFAKEFSPEDMRMIIDNAQEKVYNDVFNNKIIFIKSLESLKSNLTELCLKLGYENIMFQEVISND